MGSPSFDNIKAKYDQSVRKMRLEQAAVASACDARNERYKQIAASSQLTCPRGTSSQIVTSSMTTRNTLEPNRNYSSFTPFNQSIMFPSMPDSIRRMHRL